jgi:hypothetical protein
MCGAMEIDGYAFCLGLESLEGIHKAQVDSLNLAYPVIYLIKQSIFRPDLPMSRADSSSSLDICPLGELVDMYHTHEATKRHDKVYALLGMSSDNLNNIGLLLDYSIP